ncbi:hypothetical protein [Nocardioides mesophilus]|uniref:Uncharacterized protein n=1 Tax=Nocardioides mesophilus TaxID=433659 RepID=A0A7G9R883_9ACTN|nr:hypothetical protein [Nocardioides mesophilus]QNN51808.1 hypothetical protein H9L09_14835 [Nocardioides mesophilus]
MRTPAVFAALLLTGTVMSPVAASADATYHSTHIVLSPSPGTSGGSGFVENIHANGPNIFAHEQYHLQHATADTSYTVTLHIYGPDTTCSAALPQDVEAATLTTNAAGNASGRHVFSPQDAAVLPKGVPLGVIWTMSAGADQTYTSSCQTIILD